MNIQNIINDSNATLGVEYMQKAVELGFTEAYSGLGFAYHKGVGVEQNISKAKEYYENAYEYNNDYTALSNLGVIYLSGFPDFPKNETKAVEYMRMAAKKGVINAMFNLGVIYYQD